MRLAGNAEFPHFPLNATGVLPRSSPDQLKRLPAEWRDAVAHINAARFFGLEATVAA